MSEKQPNEPISFSRFADWCRHIDSLSEEARHTVKVLLKTAGTDDAEAAEQILSSMTRLNLSSNIITDISSLASLTNLTALHLSYNKITDISTLRSLTNLTTLDLDYNQITDISALRSLTNLTRLYLYHNQITDISALRSLTNLTELNLYNNQITPLCVLGLLAQKRLTLSTRPIDGKKAKEAIKLAYVAIGLQRPQVIICRSPGDVCPRIFNLLKRDHLENCPHKSSKRLGKNLDQKWMSPVGEFANPRVWSYELDSVTIEPEADSTLSGLMYEWVRSYVGSEQKMWNSVPNHLLSRRLHENPTTLFKEIYLTQLYISSLGVNLSEKEQEILRCQKQLFEHCGFIFAFERVCVVCDRPRHLRFDSQNRLHAEGEPAIEFADGWNFYYYHGVELPEKYGKIHPSQWQSQWLLSEHNAELRRVLIQGIGYDRICQELEAKQIGHLRGIKSVE